jgi:RHS repeat-associated protein
VFLYLRVETALPRGNLLHYTYDERLLPRSTTRGAGSPAASTVQTFHDGDGRKILVVDGRGNLTRFRYDPLNRVVAVIDALGNLQQNEYDKLSNLTVERFFQPRSDGAYDLLSRRTYEYDERGNRVWEIAHLFQAPIRTTDVEADPDAEFNTALAQASVTRVVTQYYYDRNRRLFRIVDDQNRETVYEYDGADRRVVERDALGNYTRTYYDENGNVVRVDRHEVVRNAQTGAVLREDVFSTLNEYDDLDRRVATMDGLGNRTTFTYDSRDNLASVTDPLGNVRRYEYDVFSRRVREIVEMTATGLGSGPRLADIATQYEYDENGNRVAVIDARGARTRFEFDPLDRPFRTIYPDGTDTRQEYDLDDNVVARVNNNGLRILYDVDPLKRVLRVNLDKTDLHPGSLYPAGAEEFEQYEYDGLGQVLLQRGDFCEIRLRYDSLGRAYEESVRFTTSYAPPAGPLTLRRVFDTLSNRTGLVYPNGRDVRYYYDALNRVVRLENLTSGAGYPGSTALPAQYDIAWYQYRGLRLRRMDYFNGTGCELAYDGAGRVIRLRHYSGTNRLLETQQLYDAAGNRRYQRDAPALPGRPGGEAYTYDSLYRLTRYERRTIPVINPTQFAPPTAPLPTNALNGQLTIHQDIGPLEQDTLNYTYRYDSLGNRQEERLPNQPALTYIANSLNQYQSVGQAAFQYDQNGNLVDDGSRLYRYNYRDHLSQVVDKAAGTDLLRLLYDASGRLILIREGGGAIHLLYDGPNLIEEYASGNLSAHYVNENGADRRIQSAQSGQESWYHQDMLCSTRLLTDAGGQLVARYEYEPFGSLSGPITHSNPYAFAGKRLFRALNLYDSRARQYPPTLGRFLQRDPDGMVDGPNLYTYGGNNPLTFVDPWGTEKSGVPVAEQSSPLIPKEEAALARWVQAQNLNPVWLTQPEEELRKLQNLAKAQEGWDREHEKKYLEYKTILRDVPWWHFSSEFGLDPADTMARDALPPRPLSPGEALEILENVSMAMAMGAATKPSQLKLRQLQPKVVVPESSARQTAAPSSTYIPPIQPGETALAYGQRAHQHLPQVLQTTNPSARGTFNVAPGQTGFDFVPSSGLNAVYGEMKSIKTPQSKILAQARRTWGVDPKTGRYWFYDAETGYCAEGIINTEKIGSSGRFRR